MEKRICKISSVNSLAIPLDFCPSSLNLHTFIRSATWSFGQTVGKIIELLKFLMILPLIPSSAFVKQIPRNWLSNQLSTQLWIDVRTLKVCFIRVLPSSVGLWYVTYNHNFRFLIILNEIPILKISYSCSFYFFEIFIILDYYVIIMIDSYFNNKFWSFKYNNNAYIQYHNDSRRGDKLRNQSKPECVFLIRFSMIKYFRNTPHPPLTH